MGKIEEIAIRIKELRGGESREVFAKKLGISSRALINYEQGDRLLNTETVLKFCEQLGVNAQWLLLGAEPKDSERAKMDDASSISKNKSAQTSEIIDSENKGMGEASPKKVEIQAEDGRGPRHPEKEKMPEASGVLKKEDLQHTEITTPQKKEARSFGQKEDLSGVWEELGGLKAEVRIYQKQNEELKNEIARLKEDLANETAARLQAEAFINAQQMFGLKPPLNLEKLISSRAREVSPEYPDYGKVVQEPPKPYNPAGEETHKE